jgi:hypothetical protein
VVLWADRNDNFKQWLTYTNSSPSNLPQRDPMPGERSAPPHLHRHGSDKCAVEVHVPADPGADWNDVHRLQLNAAADAGGPISNAPPRQRSSSRRQSPARSSTVRNIRGESTSVRVARMPGNSPDLIDDAGALADQESGQAAAFSLKGGRARAPLFPGGPKSSRAPPGRRRCGSGDGKRQRGFEAVAHSRRCGLLQGTSSACPMAMSASCVAMGQPFGFR